MKQEFPNVIVDVWTGVEENFVASYDAGSTHYGRQHIEKDEFMIRFHSTIPITLSMAADL